MNGKKVKDGPYSKDKFVYDEENDQFICPNGEILTRKGEYEYKGKPQYSYYGANCGECPFREDWAGKSKKRSRAMTTRQHVGVWQVKCVPRKGKRNTRSVRRLLNGLSAT